MRKLRCVYCSLMVQESEMQRYAFVCPGCGGRLEEMVNSDTSQHARTKRIRTHYDNLKIARDAPDVVVHAAYRSLCQKYHPDKNQDPEATRIMRIINAAYEVLSDPQKRREHDLWIASEESRERLATGEHHTGRTRDGSKFKSSPPPFSSDLFAVREKVINDKVYDYFRRAWGWYLCLAVVLYVVLVDELTPSSESIQHQSEPPVTTVPVRYKPPPYVRSPTAPNGRPWPATAAYVSGYERYRTSGHSTVTVDNSDSDSDAFVKLVLVDAEKAYPVRHFFVPAHSRFIVKEVSPGTYDIRYRDLATGGLLRSESFDLEERQTETGVQFNTVTITLYKVRGGNMQTYELSEEEF